MTSAELFDAVYSGQSIYGKRPPWEIDGPQPAFVALEEAGLVRGAVVDPACGTGETSIHLAAKGHRVTGFDFSRTAIDIARRKAEERGVAVTFEVDDVLAPERVSGPFDTVVDSGTARMFDATTLPTYAEALHCICGEGAVAFVLAISEQGMAQLTARLAEEIAMPSEVPQNDEKAGGMSLSVDHIRDGFAAHWTVESITDTAEKYVLPSSGDVVEPHAWLYRLHRV